VGAAGLRRHLLRGLASGTRQARTVLRVDDAQRMALQSLVQDRLSKNAPTNTALQLRTAQMGNVFDGGNIQCAGLCELNCDVSLTALCWMGMPYGCCLLLQT